MDIGSAKITPEEMQGVTHYMIDELEPDEEFHVVRFVTMAKEYLKEIYADGKIPIIAGGTGFYIQALLYDIDFTEQQCDETYRRQLEDLAREHGAEYLHGILREVDPASAEAIHANNIKRVIRALEFYHLSGKKISEHNETERQKQSPYNFAYFVLTDERAKLYERIDRRVNAMIEAGLVEEVKKLKSMGCSREMVSMQGLGYKEILAYLDGGCTLEEAVYIIKRETRHFAKRQLTWFKRERDVIWLDKQAFGYDDAAILKDMISILEEKEIISHE
jgi:tRNA dimethylallyltransferase